MLLAHLGGLREPADGRHRHSRLQDRRVPKVRREAGPNQADMARTGRLALPGRPSRSRKFSSANVAIPSATGFPRTDVRTTSTAAADPEIDSLINRSRVGTNSQSPNSIAAQLDSTIRRGLMMLTRFASAAPRYRANCPTSHW